MRRHAPPAVRHDDQDRITTAKRSACAKTQTIETPALRGSTHHFIHPAHTQSYSK